MDQDDDFKQEALPGLPELPPEGEHILWQGKPSWWALAKEALLVRWVAIYFVALAAWRGFAVGAAMDPATGLLAAGILLALGLATCLILMGVAWVLAATTVYTLTNRRVAMRIGAALTVTLNLPYRWVGSAELDLKPSGTGTIALALIGTTRLSYLVCWPHVRPWRMRRTQPALRCIPDAERVSTILAEAARAAVTRAPETGPRPAGRPHPAAVAAE